MKSVIFFSKWSFENTAFKSCLGKLEKIYIHINVYISTHITIILLIILGVFTLVMFIVEIYLVNLRQTTANTLNFLKVNFM